MTKYRLKDAELQKKLDVWSKGLFSMALQKSGKEQLNSLGPDVICEFPGLIIDKSEIEVFEEYDPNKWNKYPEVTPPEGVWMRVEQFSNNKVRRTAGIFRDGKWYGKHDVCDTYLDETLGNVTLFRPWD